MMTAVTKKDLQDLENKIDVKMDIKLNHLKNELIDEMRQWRDDFYTKIDPLLKEIMTAREDREITTFHLGDHRKRIDKLENKVFSHPA